MATRRPLKSPLWRRMVNMSEHRLGGVGMVPVSGVDDTDVRGGVPGDEVGGAAVGVAHHEHVHVHGFQVAQGIQQRLALGRRRRVDIQIQYIRRQSLGRHLE